MYFSVFQRAYDPIQYTIPIVHVSDIWTCRNQDVELRMQSLWFYLCLYLRDFWAICNYQHYESVQKNLFVESTIKSDHSCLHHCQQDGVSERFSNYFHCEFCSYPLDFCSGRNYSTYQNKRIICYNHGNSNLIKSIFLTKDKMNFGTFVVMLEYGDLN